MLRFWPLGRSKGHFGTKQTNYNSSKINHSKSSTLFLGLQGKTMLKTDNYTYKGDFDCHPILSDQFQTLHH